MATQIVLNLSLAGIWLFLSDFPSASSFVFGYLLGAFFLSVFYSQAHKQFYLVRIWKAFILFIVFFKEVIIANLSVLRYVCLPVSHLNPGIVALDIDLRSKFEIVLLANMITLTPGTLTVEITPEGNTLYIHMLDCADAPKVLAHIEKEFVNRIKEVVGYD